MHQADAQKITKHLDRIQDRIDLGPIVMPPFHRHFPDGVTELMRQIEGNRTAGVREIVVAAV